jgi:GNAT superfamily N-acetyltransferase
MRKTFADTDTVVTFRDVTVEDAYALVKLGSEVLRAPWTEAFILWKYFQNPAGEVYGRCAEVNGALVGFYGNLPLRLKVGDKVVRGVQSVDAMVAPTFRRRGLFSALCQQAYQVFPRAGISLSYGLPNAYSRAALVQLGWHYLGEIPRYTKILDVGGMVRKSKASGIKGIAHYLLLAEVQLMRPRRQYQPIDSLTIRTVTTFDERCDQLWNKVAPTLPVAVVRDTTYLNWRYAQHPLKRHTLLIAERGAELVGILVLSRRDYDKDGAVAVAEFLVRPEDQKAGLGLLAAAEKDARAQEATQLQCWMLPQHTFYVDLLNSRGFYWGARAFPRNLRYTAAFIVRMSEEAQALQPSPGTLNNWFITMGDQDYY